MQPPPPPPRGKRNANGRPWMQWTETAIQGFVLLLSLTGWYVASVEIGWNWLITLHGRHLYGGIYLLLTNTLIPTCLFLYTYLCSRRLKHSVPAYPLPSKEELTEPYACFDAGGGFKVCRKGLCGVERGGQGRWAVPRSHHCSTCGVCRMEFDHHCPWVGNCITLPHLPAFLLLLLLFACTFSIAILPISSLLCSHIARAVRLSQGTQLTKRYWWDWPGSWVVLAGPPGRWLVGGILGFWLLQADRTEGHYAGQMIEEPHFRVVGVVSLIGLLALFSLCLAGMTLYRIARGTTTFEALGISGRKRGDLVCLPMQRPLTLAPSRDTRTRTRTLNDATGRLEDRKDTPHEEPFYVFTPRPDERMYDLGWRKNLAAFWKMKVFPGPAPREFRWPKLNPEMVQRMWGEALELASTPPSGSEGNEGPGGSN